MSKSPQEISNVKKKKLEEFKAYIRKKNNFINKLTATGEVNDGLVKITTNMEYEIVRVQLSPNLFNKAGKLDIHILENLILLAANDAFKKLEEVIRKESINYEEKNNNFIENFVKSWHSLKD